MGGVGSGAKPRDYPAELVERIRTLYQSGLTVREVQEQVTGCKVQRVIERFEIPTRPAIKRDQRGPANDSWRGDEAGYAAVHLRVRTVRGAPSWCCRCDRTEGKFEWANLTGDYHDVHDYARMCVPCHRKFDAARRRQTGRRTAPRRGEVMPHV